MFLLCISLVTIFFIDLKLGRTVFYMLGTPKYCCLKVLHWFDILSSTIHDLFMIAFICLESELFIINPLEVRIVVFMKHMLGNHFECCFIMNLIILVLIQVRVHDTILQCLIRVSFYERWSLIICRHHWNICSTNWLRIFSAIVNSLTLSQSIADPLTVKPCLRSSMVLSLILYHLDSFFRRFLRQSFRLSKTVWMKLFLRSLHCHFI